MPLPTFDQLLDDADALAQPLSLAVAGGADRTVLEALRTACNRGWVRPLVAGVEQDIRRIAAESAVSLGGFTIVDSPDPATAAVALVRRGDARLLMKGQIATPVLLRAV